MRGLEATYNGVRIPRGWYLRPGETINGPNGGLSMRPVL
jgi:hypothetical protein